MPQGSELVGWKAIAGYLGVGVRTAQEYEKTLGLPVQHLPGPKGRVFANAPEIDAWRRGVRGNGEAPAPRQEPSGPIRLTALPQRLVLAVLALALSGLVLWGAYRLLRPLGPPAQLRVEEETLIIADNRGRELWRHRFPKPLEREAYTERNLQRRQTFVDLDGDGHKQVLFTYWPSEPGIVPIVNLDCFSPRGKLKWQFTPGRPISAAGERFLPPFLINSVQVIEPAAGKGKAKIAVSSNHFRSYPDQVAILDRDGKLVGEYWHSGHLLTMGQVDLNHDGKVELLLGGVDNGAGQAVLRVFDPDDVSGASVEPEGDRRQFLGLGLGSERAIMRFPRSDVSKYQAYNWVYEIQITGPDRITAAVSEGMEGAVAAGEVFYEFDYALNLISVTPSVNLVSRHKEQEARGLLDHPFSDAEVVRLRAGVTVQRPRAASR